MERGEMEEWVKVGTDSICGQLSSCVPGNMVQLSPALAKLTEVGSFIFVRKEMGMMLTGVSV